MNINNTFCKKCKLYKKVNSPCIEGRGNPSAPILLLGEGPGETEDRQAQVFVGRSGQLLQNFVNAFNLDCYISNAILCRNTDASGNNKAPTAKQIEYCRASTIDLILKMKPKVIVAVGKIALQQLIKTSISMEVIHGKALYHPELNTYIVPTFHPAFLLRNEDQRFITDFRNDLEIALTLSKSPPRRRIPSVPITISDPIEIKKYLTNLRNVSALVIDLETTGLNPKKDRITDISLCCEIGKGVHIKWDYISESIELINLLKEILLSPNIEKVFHNAGFDISFLRSIGFDVKLPIFDTMLAYHTATMSFEGGRASALYRLKTMAWFLTQEGGYEDVLNKYGGIVNLQQEEENEESTSINNEDEEEEELLFSKTELARAAGLDVELEERLNFAFNYIENSKEAKLTALNLKPKEYYSAMDADITFRSYKYLKVEIDSNYSFVYYNIIIPTCLTLLRVEENGIKINIPYIDKLIEENNEKAESVRQLVMKSAGYEFNINSSDQIGYYMYKHLKLPVNKKHLTVKGQKPSTDESAISFYKTIYPELNNILEYRGIAKQTSTYLVGYKDLIDESSRVYPSYNQIGTATGRLSCNSPNLQNIPRDNRIRNMIIPKEGHKFVIYDLSQVELRVLAMLSNDMAMLNAFASGHDFHSYTACIMFNIPVDKFNKEDKHHAEYRTISKTINFGIVYGRGANSVAEDLGIPLNKAEAFMLQFFNAYPKIMEWNTATIGFVLRNGYVETLYGRRRYLPDIYSSIPAIRAEAERKAINTPVQSSASDIFSIGMNRYQAWIDEKNYPISLVGTVHDSVISEVPDELIPEVEANLYDIVTKDIPRVSVELKADIEILDKWVK